MPSIGHRGTRWGGAAEDQLRASLEQELGESKKGNAGIKANCKKARRNMP
jgi:hypothetical protein